MIEQEIMQALSTPGMTEAAQYALGGFGIKKLYDDFASPTIKQAGLLGAKVFSALAISIDVWAEKRKKRFMNLQNDLADNLKNKNPEDITENPPDYILAPAISSYMVSIDKKELREMYAKLISKALLKEYEDKIHPSFALLIQNLHPNECIILQYFSTRNEIPVISTFWRKPKAPGAALSLNNIFCYPTRIITSSSGAITTFSYKDFVLGNPMYLSNLCRLGLIEKTYLATFRDISVYKPLFDLPIVKDDEQRCKLESNSYDIQKGILKLTPLGKEFTDICIGDIS